VNQRRYNSALADRQRAGTTPPPWRLGNAESSAVRGTAAPKSIKNAATCDQRLRPGALLPFWEQPTFLGERPSSSDALRLFHEIAATV